MSSNRYKAIITIQVREQDILEAENLFPMYETKDAIKALMNHIYWEATGKTYEEDGAFLDIVDLQ